MVSEDAGLGAGLLETGDTSYTRLPERLRALLPEAAKAEPEDVFGIEDRFKAIRTVLHGRPAFERAVDLGGHSGYFSLSLVDAGVAGRSTVYDIDSRALAAGRAMAARMELSGRVTYVEQPVDLAFVRTLPPVDLVICLNLIHHAGARFDIEAVKARGWGDYAAEWLTELRKRSRVALLGAGFKTQRPMYWDARNDERARRFCEIARRAGWSVLYDANVEDIRTVGVERANGQRTGAGRAAPKAPGILQKVARKLSGAPPDRSRRQKYHLFILENGSGNPIR